jgi:hypothetical protein
MKLAEVHTIYEANCRSIPDMLRQSAKSIETEIEEGYSPTVAMVAVQVTQSGKIQVYGWGDTSMLHAMGVLHAGLQEIGGMVLDTGDD